MVSGLLFLRLQVYERRSTNAICSWWTLLERGMGEPWLLTVTTKVVSDRQKYASEGRGRRVGDLQGRTFGAFPSAPSVSREELL